MQSITDDIEKLVTAAGDLAETKIEIVRLKAAGKVAASLSHLVTIMMLLALIGSAMLIISIGLAILIGQSLDNMSYGFFIIGGIYALAGVLAYANRKTWVQRPLSDIFIDKMVN
jgi:hypothetical protein